MISVSAQVVQDEVSVVVPGLANGLAKPELLMPPLALVLQREMGTIFREQSDPVTGAKWQQPGGLTLSLRPKGGAGGEALKDTGRLRNALVSARPKIVGNQVSVDTTGVPYAAMQNFGGVQRPKRAKMLAIPLTSEAKRAGTARRWWSRNEDQKPFVFGKGRRLFIATNDQRGRLVLHYMLRDSVTIPQRRFIGVSPRLVDRSMKVATAVVGKIVADAKREAKRT